MIIVLQIFFSADCYFGNKGNLVIESDGHLSILQAILTNTMTHHVFGGKIKKTKKARKKLFLKVYLKQVLLFFFPHFVIVYK
jgi:hypothetical protein